MDVKFNIDICKDELNLPPLESYEEAKNISHYIKTGNFIKEHWERLKFKITDDERNLNEAMRIVAREINIERKAVEVDYCHITEKENIFWFRPSECFVNVIVPTFMLNGRQSTPQDRFRIIVNSYHAAIFDCEDSILYDPTLDVIDAVGGNYSSEEKKVSTLGLLMSEEAISVRNTDLAIGTLRLSEYLNKYRSTVNDCCLREVFNETVKREIINYDSKGHLLLSSYGDEIYYRMG